MTELGVVSPNIDGPNIRAAADVSGDIKTDVRSFLACSAATAIAFSTVGLAMAYICAIDAVGYRFSSSPAMADNLLTSGNGIIPASR